MPNSFKKFDSLTLELNESLQELSEAEITQIEKYEQSIARCTECLTRLRELVLKEGFSSNAEEIAFFKHIKPKILEKLFFFTYTAKFEASKVFYAHDSLIAYHEAHLAKVHAYVAEHENFFYYYKSGSTHNDQRYFKRRGCDFRNLGTTDAFKVDQDFSTFYDLILGELLAKKEFSKFLHQSLHELRHPHIHQHNGKAPVLSWTASKAALTEIIYAFHAFGCFNNGDASLSDIRTHFETTLNLPLKDFFKKGYEIRGRKGKVRFLDKLKAALDLNQMDFSDN